MAELAVEGNELVLRLRTVEKAEALHGDLRFPLSSVRHVHVLEDPLGAVHGLRSPGTGVPALVAVGTYRDRTGKTFAVVHHDTGRGVQVDLEDTTYDRLVVGCADPETVAARLGGRP